MKKVLYVVPVRSQVDNIFTYHKQNKSAHKTMSVSERWIEFKDDYKVWYKTIEEVKQNALRGSSWDEIIAPSELEGTAIHHAVFLPSLYNSRGKIIWE